MLQYDKKIISIAGTMWLWATIPSWKTLSVMKTMKLIDNIPGLIFQGLFSKDLVIWQKSIESVGQLEIFNPDPFA